MKTLCGLIPLIFLISCDPFVPTFPNGVVEGMRPVYVDSVSFAITRQESRAVVNPGKIYVYGNALLINEVDEGIHVIDNSDKTNPKNLFFINIPGNTDMAVKDGLIYANNHTDMVVIKVSETDFETVNRIENLFFEPLQTERPDQHDVYFECVDQSKGKVIGWEVAMIKAPECYRK